MFKALTEVDIDFVTWVNRIHGNIVKLQSFVSLLLNCLIILILKVLYKEDFENVYNCLFNL